MLEQQFSCNKNSTIYQCSIWTDGIYAIKTKTYDGQPKFKIEDFIFEEIKDGSFDNGNIIVKNGIVKKCNQCDKNRKKPTQFLIHKYIVFNKIPNYNRYIKTNRIDDLKMFNKNGYFLAFKNKKEKNDNKYLFIYRDRNDKLKAVYNNVSTFLYCYDENYFGENFNLFYLDIDNFTYEKFNDNINYSLCDNKENLKHNDTNQESKIHNGAIKNMQEQYNNIAKEIKNNKEREKCIQKVYSLKNDGRIFNEDMKKNGDDIAMFDKKKQEKIVKMLKKTDYDFLK